MTPNQKLYITLGRTGDVLNMLPILYADAQAGNRAGMMVAKEFAEVLDGCSYLDPYVFDGGPHELDRAAHYGRTLKKDIVFCQTAGPLDAVQRNCYQPAGFPHAQEESFQKTQWRMAGRLADWKKQLPLVFDVRDKQREAGLVEGWTGHKKHILLHTKGTSSPFPYVDLLKTLIELRFKRGYQVHDLNDVKAARLFDLLACYEKAHVLIAIDSAPLHLAYACQRLPVVALVNDRPLLWNGACWRPNHIKHIRYTDFPSRCVEILDAIERIGETAHWFCPEVKTPKIIHIWSTHELTDKSKARHEAAKATWQKAYETNHWVSTPLEHGFAGRDTRSSLRDEKRFCYLKDAIRLAALRAGEGDIICLTRHDTCFKEGITKTILKSPLSYAHRTVVDGESYSWHPFVDMFCIPKTWWQAHQKEMPDMILGQDIFWPRVLQELMKMNGAVELPFMVYREAAKKEAA